MNEILAFIASFLMVFFTGLIVASVLFGSVIMALDLWQKAARRSPSAQRVERERRSQRRSLAMPESHPDEMAERS